MANAEKFGLLSLRHVELPPKSAAHKARMDKTNTELAGTGFRTYRLAYDWGYQAYADLLSPSKKGVRHEDIKTPFKSGDLVKVFKTVTEGEVAWQGTVDLDRKHYHHGLQKGIKAERWGRMFYNQLPARLEREGAVTFGALEPFCETGTEGVIWSLNAYGKDGYDALMCLENGDKLTVYKNVRDGEVDWEGSLDFTPEAVFKLDYHEVIRQTKHMDSQKWLRLSFQRRPIAIIPS